MTKMVQAQTSISVAKLVSAIRPLPREFKKLRIAETGSDEDDKLPSVAGAAGIGALTGDAPCSL
nr:hypothetical protein [Edaphobacter modestus]